MFGLAAVGRETNIMMWFLSVGRAFFQEGPGTSLLRVSGSNKPIAVLGSGT